MALQQAERVTEKVGIFLERDRDNGGAHISLQEVDDENVGTVLHWELEQLRHLLVMTHVCQVQQQLDQVR